MQTNFRGQGALKPVGKVSQAGGSSPCQGCSREQADNPDLPRCTKLARRPPRRPARRRHRRRRRWLARGAAVRSAASRRLGRSAPVRALLQDSAQFQVRPAAPTLPPPPAPPRARLLWLLQAPPKERCLRLRRASSARTEGGDTGWGKGGGEPGGAANGVPRLTLPLAPAPTSPSLCAPPPPTPPPFTAPARAVCVCSGPASERDGRRSRSHRWVASCLAAPG